MPLDVGRVSHLIEQMHRSEDDAGDPIVVGKVLVTDGSRGFTWEDFGGSVSIPFDHGAMGATETVDLADGDWHRGTLSADCAITVQGFTNDEGATLLFEVTQDSGTARTITWDADVDFGGADDQPSTTLGSVTTFMLWSSVGDGTIYGAKVGGSSGATSLDDLSDVTITAVATDDMLQYNGSVWVNSSKRWEAVTDGEDVFVWESDDLVHEWETY